MSTFSVLMNRMYTHTINGKQSRRIGWLNDFRSMIWRLLFFIFKQVVLFELDKVWACWRNLIEYVVAYGKSILGNISFRYSKMIGLQRLKPWRIISIAIRFLQFAFFRQRKQPILGKVRHFIMPNKIIDRTVFVYLINLYTYLIDK